jgi:hypothetical protein
MLSSSSSAGRRRERRPLAARSPGGPRGEDLRLTRDNPIRDGREGRQRRGQRLEICRRQAVLPGVGGRDGREDLAHRNHEGASEADEHVRTGIGFRQFDASDVFVVQAGQLRQAFLRKLSLEPQATQLVAERAQDGRPWARLSGR